MKQIGIQMINLSVAGRTGLRVIAFSACSLFLLSGCAQQKKDLYYWGDQDYEQSLSAHFVDAEDEKAYALLTAIVADADSNNYRLAPGIRAEYGYWLYRQGKTADAIASFEKEAKDFPESAFLMNKLVERLKQDNRERGRTEPESHAMQTAVPANSHGGEQ